MCIACELGFLDMLEALPPETRERILREEAARFACDVPQTPEPAAAPKPEDERKP
jgi:hypothetical protein